MWRSPEERGAGTVRGTGVAGMKRAWSALALAVVLSVPGCGVGDESLLQFGVYGEVEALRPLLTLTARSGGWLVEVTGAELGGGASQVSEAFELPDRSTVVIRAALARPGGEPLDSVTVELDIRRDWIWKVDVFLTDRNPFDSCLGCVGYRVVALPEELVPEVGDSLYVVWGGNSIRDPVTF